MKEIVGMSVREVQRIQVLDQVLKGNLSLKRGTNLIGICCRQAKRLLNRYRQEGMKRLVHRLRGQPSRNAVRAETRDLGK